jgi:hypothetical protein
MYMLHLAGERARAKWSSRSNCHSVARAHLQQK